MQATVTAEKPKKTAFLIHPNQLQAASLKPGQVFAGHTIHSGTIGANPQELYFIDTTFSGEFQGDEAVTERERIQELLSERINSNGRAKRNDRLGSRETGREQAESRDRK